MKNKRILILFAIALIGLVACKKSKKVEPEASRADQTRDSIFLYAKEVYFWNSLLPSYEAFNPRKYNSESTALGNYEAELLGIAKYSAPYDYHIGDSYPRFSYISDQADQNPTAAVKTLSVNTEGDGYGVGIRLVAFGADDRFILYVTAVDQNSPAEAAGFTRGDLITKINGVTYGTNYGAVSRTIYGALEGASVNLEGIRGNGVSFNVNLVRAIFESSPIYRAKTIAVDNKRIGYLAYARFSNTENSEAALNRVFSDFATSGVTDLVIDLRYNLGGYVHIAEHLMNLIIPANVDKQIMFSEHYNAIMKKGGATILSHQPLLDGNGKIRYAANGRMLTNADVDYSVEAMTSKFAKAGNLNNVKNIVFLVSGYSASASELVINSLRPYMNVKLVGEVTYGKPVGFFPITIENKYDVFFAMFETRNAVGDGGYYSGLTPDYPLASELSANDVMYDFGNINDAYLKKAIDLLAPNANIVSQARVSSALMSVLEKKNISTSKRIGTIKGDEFTGMIETSVGKKLK